jgi:hypothetical protein
MCFFFSPPFRHPGSNDWGSRNNSANSLPNHTHTDDILFAYAGTICEEADMFVTISREPPDNQTMANIPYEVLNKTFNSLLFYGEKLKEA